MHLALPVRLCSETEHLNYVYDALLSLKGKHSPLPRCGLEGVWGNSIPPGHLPSLQPHSKPADPKRITPTTTHLDSGAQFQV